MRTLDELEEERAAWSLETFDTTAQASLEKLKGEIAELEQDMANGVDPIPEFVDCLMCLLDAGRRLGITINAVLPAYEQKTTVNKARSWRKNPNGSYSHIKVRETVFTHEDD